MNPRLFCRERSYHKALLLTYSFDPIFFEQVVLPDLWAGRSSDILVLGDGRQIDTSIQASVGQLWSLGKHYLLGAADVPGAFHPKVFLRLGPKDGIVMLGSGNVTSSGWGGNQELGTAWMVGPDHEDKGGWLHAFLDDVLTWCQGDLEHGAVRRFKDVPWLSLTPEESAVTVPMLHSRRTNSLSFELSRRWTGRRFDEVKILTGSTDESGAYLRWAHATFGITRATVALTPSSGSFVAESLADLPLELRLVAAPTGRLLHAKFYWFDGVEGPAAVMGSANCSAAAWLLAPAGGGNIESVVIYDQPDADNFAGVLELFVAPGQCAAEFLKPRAFNDSKPPALQPSFAIKSLKWHSAFLRMYAEIYPVPDPTAQVALLLGERRISMALSPGPTALWTCDIADGLGAATVFASVMVILEHESWTTSVHWVDDIAALTHASHAARLLEPFKSLERSTSSAEQRKMLDELQEVAHTLFNDTASFRDPSLDATNRRQANDAPAKPVNPNDLVVHLDESDSALRHFASVGPGSLSLTGILRLLFESEVDEGGAPAATGDEDIDEDQMPDGTPSPKLPNQKESIGEDPAHPAIEARFREQLASQIDTFLAEMSSPGFSGRCSATQMVQAVSFPLAVALRGRRRGWVADELAENWALKIFSILFRGTGPRASGLLRSVHQRYVQNGHANTFEDVVGDGTLWLVLVATLGGTRWRGVGTQIDKAVAVREIFSSPLLLASANSDRVTGLLGTIQIEDAKEYVAYVAPRVNRLVEEIECVLTHVWEVEMQGQRHRAVIHKVGDILWRDSAKAGWAVCLEEIQDRTGQPIKVRLKGTETAVQSGYYVNVSEVCSRNFELKLLLEKLCETIEGE